MNNKVWAILLVVLAVSCCAQYTYEENQEVMNTQTHVYKKILDNGLTILVRPSHIIPKVSIQLWYHVGSKDEKTGEKGIAHLIEHMIFKGTKKLSETDINIVGQMLSAVSNAFTSNDYTGYLFDLPTHHWQEALPIMADCMQNCTFKDDHLNSEMKAVIKELKMNRDNYVRTLVLDMVSAIFPDHPYHYPTIGYKHDLYNVRGKDLMAFYKKHYVPNNATLVVVGDVQPEEVFSLAQKHFGAIPAKKDYSKETFYHTDDIISRSLTLYRDVQQPTVALAFVAPGKKAKKRHALDIASLILGGGKSSRLQDKLVNQLQLATSLSVFPIQFFDYSVFYICFEPQKIDDTERIIKIINDELDQIAAQGVKQEEFVQALRQAKTAQYNLLENSQRQANAIGESYLATGDAEYPFTYLELPEKEILKDTNSLFADYLRPAVGHRGYILPIPAQEKKEWLKLQEEADREDKEILEKRKRDTQLEGPSYAKTITPKEPGNFNFPKPAKTVLNNGLKVLSYNNDNTPKIIVAIDFIADARFDPEDLQGLGTFMSSMMTEGTKNYTGEQLAKELESRSISLSVYPGGVMMSLLKEDLPKALELLNEVLAHATFDPKKMEKIRAQMLAEVKNFWDEPESFASLLVRKHLYKGHPYSKNEIGTLESIKAITQQDLVNHYKKYISPHGGTLAIVGDLEGYDIPQLLNKAFASWQGQEVKEYDYPSLQPVQETEIIHPINRDQIILCYAGLSVSRLHPDFDKYLLFNKIFAEGLGSRLYQIREQTGLFYKISGSLTSRSEKQPGMAVVQTLVSRDDLAKTEELLKNTLDTVADTLTEADVAEAKRSVITRLAYNFESNAGIANALLLVDKYNYPINYFDTRADVLRKITVQEIKDAVKKVLKTNQLLTLKIGRLEDNKKAIA